MRRQATWTAAILLTIGGVGRGAEPKSAPTEANELWRRDLPAAQAEAERAGKPLLAVVRCER